MPLVHPRASMPALVPAALWRPSPGAQRLAQAHPSAALEVLLLQLLLVLLLRLLLVLVLLVLVRLLLAPLLLVVLTWVLVP